MMVSSKHFKISLRHFIAIGVLLLLPGLCFAFERYACTAYWYNGSIPTTLNRQADRITDCGKLGVVGRKMGKYYLVVNGKAYWTHYEKERSGPCPGMGVGAMGNMINPVCYLPSWLQINHTQEERSYWLVSTDGDHFQLIGTNHKNMVAWQRDTMARYTVDRSSVYLNSVRLPGADPKTFEVLFPYGSTEEWSYFSFGRDQQHSYIDEYAFPLIALDKVTWLPLPCIEGSFSCKDSGDVRTHIGRVGRDILFLQYGSRPTVFHDKAGPNLFCFRSDAVNYCRTGGKLYAIKPDFEVEASLVLQKPAVQRQLAAKLAAAKQPQ